jgi:hypothetical protein
MTYKEFKRQLAAVKLRVRREALNSIRIAVKNAPNQILSIVESPVPSLLLRIPEVQRGVTYWNAVMIHDLFIDDQGVLAFRATFIDDPDDQCLDSGEPADVDPDVLSVDDLLDVLDSVEKAQGGPLTHSCGLHGFDEMLGDQCAACDATRPVVGKQEG